MMPVRDPAPPSAARGRRPPSRRNGPASNGSQDGGGNLAHQHGKEGRAPGTAKRPGRPHRNSRGGRPHSAPSSGVSLYSPATGQPRVARLGQRVWVQCGSSKICVPRAPPERGAPRQGWKCRVPGCGKLRAHSYHRRDRAPALCWGPIPPFYGYGTTGPSPAEQLQAQPAPAGPIEEPKQSDARSMRSAETHGESGSPRFFFFFLSSPPPRCEIDEIRGDSRRVRLAPLLFLLLVVAAAEL